MNRLAENFVLTLEAEVVDLERIANETEATAQEYGQAKPFRPYVEWHRYKAAELRELIEKMRSDPAFD